MKRVLVINSMVAHSHVGITAQLPVFTQAGIEATVLPCGLFSANLAFPQTAVSDASQWLIAALKQYERMAVSFDGICIGMLGKKEVIFSLLPYLHLHASAIKVIDPVFADHGVYYRGFDETYVQALSQLIPYFDVMTPNMSEACFLMGENPKELFAWQTLLKKMAGRFQIQVVITGVQLDEDQSHLYILYGDEKQAQTIKIPKEQDYCGAGDVFSALLCRELIEGKRMGEAVASAVFTLQGLFADALKKHRDPLMGLPLYEKAPFLDEG